MESVPAMMSIRLGTGEIYMETAASVMRGTAMQLMTDIQTTSVQVNILLRFWFRTIHNLSPHYSEVDSYIHVSDHIDSHITWDVHVNSVCSRIQQRLYVLMLNRE